MTLFQELIGREKPVIGMAHFPPLPGSPQYDAAGGVEKLVESIRRDVVALQEGGVDAVLFGNEGDLPYLTRVGPEVPAVMARVITEVKGELSVPFGVDVLWDPRAAIALAVATGARFVREVFTGLWAGDLGLWQPNAGEALRYRKLLDAESIRLFFNINAEFTGSLDNRQVELVARSVAFSSLADALCVSGPITGDSVNPTNLERVKQAVPHIPVIANTGVRRENVARILQVADAVIVGTALKVDGYTWNPVDPDRVRAFIQAADAVRCGGEQR